MKYGVIAAVSALALSIAASASANANTLIVYHFDPGSVYDFGDGNIYAATGSFTYDATLGAVTAVDYHAVQIGTGPTGPFDFTSATTVSPTDVIFTGDCCGDQDEYFFARSLASGGTIAITGGYYSNSGIGYAVAASGSVTAVPEPATWAMMLVGFAGLGMAARSASRKNAAPAA